MLNAYKKIIPQLEGLNRKDQYKILLQTKEWYEFRERMVYLDNHTCQKCNKKEGPIEVEVMTEEEQSKINKEIYEYNMAFLKHAKENPDSTYNALLDGTFTGKKLRVSRFDIVGNVVIQLHHKLYFWNKLPWEYERKYLMTLCYECHKDEHRDNQIYLYQDETMQYRREIPICWKCDGTGYLKEYNHIDYGNCWACDGAGIIFSESPAWIPVN